MEEFLEWLKTLDWSNVCAAMWTFVSVYGISLFGLVIGILKLKSKNANFIEKLEQVQIVLKNEYLKHLAEFKTELELGLEKLKDNIVEKNTKLNQEKIEAINKVVVETKASVEKLDPIQNFNIDKALNDLGELI